MIVTCVRCNVDLLEIGRTADKIGTNPLRFWVTYRCLECGCTVRVEPAPPEQDV